MSATRIHIDGIILIISLLIASLFALLGSSFYVLNEDIELQLITDVRERLDEVGYQVSIDFDGRDGTVGGNAIDEQTVQEIVDITKNVAGVRTVTNELTIAPLEKTIQNEKDEGMGLSGITDNIDQNTALVESIDDLVASSISSDVISEDSDVNHNIDEAETSPLNLTEVTGQPIIEESIISYQTDETNLSPEHTVALDSITPLLTTDSSLYVEMSSFYKNPAIAIKRTDIIKAFFEEKGIDKKHFDVIWNDSPKNNQVKIRLFHSK